MALEHEQQTMQHPVCIATAPPSTTAPCTGYQWLAQGVFLLVFPVNLLLTTLARAAAILRCRSEPGEGHRVLPELACCSTGCTALVFSAFGSATGPLHGVGGPHA